MSVIQYSQALRFRRGAGLDPQERCPILSVLDSGEVFRSQHQAKHAGRDNYATATNFSEPTE
jgi:hypothetical protein